MPFAVGLAVAVVIVSELTEEHAGWELERNERCSRSVVFMSRELLPLCGFR